MGFAVDADAVEANVAAAASAENERWKESRREKKLLINELVANC